MKNGETKIQQMNCFDLLMMMMMMRKNHLDLLEGSSFVVVLLVWTAIFLLAVEERGRVHQGVVVVRVAVQVTQQHLHLESHEVVLVLGLMTAVAAEVRLHRALARSAVVGRRATNKNREQATALVTPRLGRDVGSRSS